jgi:hypothetical protein
MIRPPEEIFKKTLGSKKLSSMAEGTEMIFAFAKLTAMNMPAPVSPLSLRKSRREKAPSEVFVVSEVPDMERLAFVFFILDIVANF